MKRVICLSLLFLNIGTSFANEQEYKTINDVITAFEQSIETKDKPRFLSLFTNSNAPMVGVVSGESMKLRRAAVERINREDNKNFKVTRTWVTSPEKMIDRIIASKAVSKEVFNNIKVVSDDSIASIYFDYEFFKDDVKKHWGAESWQMVQTMKGWKISSINYSITFLEKAP